MIIMWKSTLKIILMSHTQADSFICKTVRQSLSWGKQDKIFFLCLSKDILLIEYISFFFKYLILV